MDFAAVILAAGKSKRMKSALPKAVHLLCGKPIARHVVDACLRAGVPQIVVVVGHGADRVREAVGNDVDYALQKEQLGTGHAAMQAMPHVTQPNVLVLPGDAPLTTSDSIKSVMSRHLDNRSAATLLTAVIDDPSHYGRIVRGPDGDVERIVEARDAPPDVLTIREIATSIYCFDAGLLAESLSRLRSDNSQGEYYLTDTIEIMKKKGLTVFAYLAENYKETLGVNTREELLELEK